MREIAKLLESNARLTPAEIATMLGRDEQEVRETIEKMEKEGIIVRYGAKINWERLGESSRVFATVKVCATPERDVGFDAIAQRIVNFPEVHSLYLISGDHDFEVVVEGDTMRDIALFVAERLAVIPGITSTATHFVLRTYKKDGDVLFEPPEDRRLAVAP